MTPVGIHTKTALVRRRQVRSSLSTAAQTSKAGCAVVERWQQNRQLRNDEGQCRFVWPLCWGRRFQTRIPARAKRTGSPPFWAVTAEPVQRPDA